MMPEGGKGKMGRKTNKLPQQKGVVQMENDKAERLSAHQNACSGY